MVLPRHRGSILPQYAWSPAATTADIEVDLLYPFHESHIAPCVPIEPTPDDRLDVMEAGDPVDLSKDARLEDALDDPYPEVCQRLQKPICPSAVGEVIQLQVASSDPEVEPLPFGILSGIDPTVEVGAIVLMDCATVDTEEPTVGIGEALLVRVLLSELRLRAGAGHKVAMHALLSPTGHPTCVSRCADGGVQVGVGNGRGRCREVGSLDECPGVPIAAGTASAAVRADSLASQGRQSSRRRLRSLGDCAHRRGREGALGYSLNGLACRRDAQSIPISDRRRCSQSCRWRTRSRSRPPCAGRVARSQTSGRGRQAALSCIGVPGRRCRRSSRGLTPSRPPCASRGTR
jgi:hypothetical protein